MTIVKDTLSAALNHPEKWRVFFLTTSDVQSVLNKINTCDYSAVHSDHILKQEHSESADLRQGSTYPENFIKNPSISFSVILFTNKRTNQLTRKHNFLGGGN